MECVFPLAWHQTTLTSVPVATVRHINTPLKLCLSWVSLPRASPVLLDIKIELSQLRVLWPSRVCDSLLPLFISLMFTISENCFILLSSIYFVLSVVINYKASLFVDCIFSMVCICIWYMVYMMEICMASVNFHKAQYKTFNWCPQT